MPTLTRRQRASPDNSSAIYTCGGLVAKALGTAAATEREPVPSSLDAFASLRCSPSLLAHSLPFPLHTSQSSTCASCYPLILPGCSAHACGVSVPLPPSRCAVRPAIDDSLAGLALPTGHVVRIVCGSLGTAHTAGTWRSSPSAGERSTSFLASQGVRTPFARQGVRSRDPARRR